MYLLYYNFQISLEKNPKNAVVILEYSSSGFRSLGWMQTFTFSEI